MEYLESLNGPQRDAVTTINGPMLVIAGAGSGKTRVLTMRIAHLLRNGVKPYNILALTFTNKAANEMKERIAGIVGAQTAANLWMGTFHSIFAKILRIEAQAVGFRPDFTIYDTADTKSLIRSIVKNMKLSDKEYKESALINAISTAKNELVMPSAYPSNTNYTARDKAAHRPLTANIYATYMAECRKANAMDFDDLLLFTNLLFMHHPEILKKYQDKFGFILVDEYQDTNLSQYIIIKKLAEQSHNICVVGDDAQSIYSFRGAKIENILRFRDDYPESKTFKLEQNYRSTQNIVNAANSIISHNQGQIKKTVFSENDEGEKVRIISAHSDREEAAMVCKDIASRIITERMKMSDFAILYRTNNQSRAFEEEMRKQGLRYHIFGGTAFYQRREIKDIMAYLRLCVNPSDSEALKRVINTPKRGIGATTIDKIQALANAHNLTLWDAMQPQALAAAGISGGTANKISGFVAMMSQFAQQAETLNAYELTAEIMTQSGLMKMLTEEKNEPDGKERYENVNEMLNGLKEFVDDRTESGDDTSIRPYLENVALVSDLDNENHEATDTITLMTIHSSKGLEFNSVYIVGVEEELFPAQQQLTGGNPQAIEEERRLFYVALTRAQQQATISYTLSRFRNGQHMQSRPSRFVAEIDSAFTSRPAGMNVSSGFGNSSFRYTPRQQASAFARPQAQPPRPAAAMPRRLTPVRNSAPSAFRPQASNGGSDAAAAKFPVGTRVVHETFGKGVVTAIEGTSPNTKLTIDFEHTGTKHLLLKFARLKAL